MNAPKPIPFTPDWPEPARRFLRSELPPAPELSLYEVLSRSLARWVEEAAEAKGAPPDYVFAALLAAAGAIIGNTRWVLIWEGWSEPPIIWTMLVGLPSAGKSPAIDAVLQPLRRAERRQRKAAVSELASWREKAETSKLFDATWKESVRAAIKAGEEPPARPSEAVPGPEPHIPRLVVNDTTVERLGAILARQPRGTLQMRDELTGWLEGMLRYSGGSSDRPFWLEAFGGRDFTVDRMSREPITIDRLAIGVLGGIQPDRLKRLLFKADDDGLVARFVPIWPSPVALCRPKKWTDEALFDKVIERLLEFQMEVNQEGEEQPRYIPFAEDARCLMDEFRIAVRAWEAEAEGLMLSFIGKLPGLAARLSLVLGCLDRASAGDDELREVTAIEFGRAAHLLEAYFMPMARRSYADAETPKVDRAAMRLVDMIRDRRWQSFSTRDVMRLDRSGFRTKSDIDPALDALVEGDCIRLVDSPSKKQGGRPSRLYSVNPALHGG